MTHEELLERQVEALEKLLQLKQAIIDELEGKVDKLQQQLNPPSWTINTPNFQPFISTPSYPSWQCTDGNPHQYPQVWNSVLPPHCSKCGAQAAGNTVWSGSTSGHITVSPTITTQTIPNWQGNSNITTAVGGSNVTLTGGNNLPVNTAGLVQPVQTIGVDGISQTSYSVVPLSSAAKK